MPDEFRLVDLRLLYSMHVVVVLNDNRGVLDRSVGIFMIPDEFRPSLMFYTASSLSFSSAFRYTRSHFRYSHVLLEGLRKKDRLLVVY